MTQQDPGVPHLGDANGDQKRDDRDPITRCHDLIAAAKNQLLTAACFLTHLTVDTAPAEPLRHLRATLEGIAASCKEMDHGLRLDTWGALKLHSGLTIRDMTGWDQHLLSAEQRKALLKAADARRKVLDEETEPTHEGAARCDWCGGVGFEHIDSQYGLLIGSCEYCDKFDNDADAVAAHRAVCGCSFPEVAPADLWAKHIALEKGYGLEGIACPRCGQNRGFWLEAQHAILIHDRRVIELDSIEFDDDTRTTCIKCSHSGWLSEFCPNM